MRAGGHPGFETGGATSKLPRRARLRLRSARPVALDGRRTSGPPVASTLHERAAARGEREAGRHGPGIVRSVVLASPLAKDLWGPRLVRRPGWFVVSIENSDRSVHRRSNVARTRPAASTRA